MPPPISDIDAQSILKNVKRSARAKAILNRPFSVIPSILVASISGASCTAVILSSKFEVPLSVIVIIVVSVVGTITGVMENYTIRRRLEAAIELLQLQEEKHYS